MGASSPLFFKSWPLFKPHIFILLTDNNTDHFSLGFRCGLCLDCSGTGGVGQKNGDSCSAGQLVLRLLRLGFGQLPSILYSVTFFCLLPQIQWFLSIHTAYIHVGMALTKLKPLPTQLLPLDCIGFASLSCLRLLPDIFSFHVPQKKEERKNKESKEGVSTFTFCSRCTSFPLLFSE